MRPEVALVGFGRRGQRTAEVLEGELPAILRAIAPHLRPGATVVDMASVKVKPLGG